MLTFYPFHLMLILDMAGKNTIKTLFGLQHVPIYNEKISSYLSEELSTVIIFRTNITVLLFQTYYICPQQPCLI